MRRATTSNRPRDPRTTALHTRRGSAALAGRARRARRDRTIYARERQPRRRRAIRNARRKPDVLHTPGEGFKPHTIHHSMAVSPHTDSPLNCDITLAVSPHTASSSGSGGGGSRSYTAMSRQPRRASMIAVASPAGPPPTITVDGGPAASSAAATAALLRGDDRDFLNDGGGRSAALVTAHASNTIARISPGGMESRSVQVCRCPAPVLLKDGFCRATIQLYRPPPHRPPPHRPPPHRAPGAVLLVFCAV